MVKKPEEYPWSSYHFNALGQDDLLITPHPVFKTLGGNEVTCHANYSALFKHHISGVEIEEIRTATNKAWVLGDNRFKIKVERLINRQVQPKSRGGDRRSEALKRRVVTIESDPIA
jgi:putative transposase